MRTIPIERIIIGEDRQRKEFDADNLTSLSESIQEVGLLSPIILRSTENPILVAGERRIRAIKLLYGRGHGLRFCGEDITPGEIPYVYHESVNDYMAELAELDENIHRADLTWQEKSAALNRLHRLKQQLNPGQTVTDTAREVWGSDFHTGAPAQVKEAVLLEQHMSDPKIAKASTKKEAVRAVQKKLKEGLYAQLAPKTADSDGSIPFSKHTLKLGDARELFKELPDAHYSCIIADPPYGIGANTFGDQAIGDHNYNDSQQYFENLMRSFAVETFRVSTNQAHAYVFCDFRRYAFLETVMEDAGWYVWGTPLVWYKGNMGHLPRPEHGPRRTYEMILYAIKGDRRVILTGQHDVITEPSVGSERHAAEKPVPLYTNLLSRSVRPGEFVLDPFAGSGTIFPAANKLSLIATGFNLDQNDYALAQTRLEEK